MTPPWTIVHRIPLAYVAGVTGGRRVKAGDVVVVCVHARPSPLPQLHLFTLDPPVAYSREGHGEETRQAVFVGMCLVCFVLHRRDPLACPCDAELLVHGQMDATRGQGQLLA